MRKAVCVFAALVVCVSAAFAQNVRQILGVGVDGNGVYHPIAVNPDGTILIGGAGISQVNSDWNSASGVSQILNKPTLATVATSGAYSDLSGKPTLAAVAISGAYSDLSGKPTLSTVATSGAYSDLSGKPTLATVATTGDYNDLLNLPGASSGGTSAGVVAGPGSTADLIGTIANTNIGVNSTSFFTDNTQSYCAGPAYCSFGTFIADTMLAAMSNPSAFPAASLLNLVNKFVAAKNGNGEFPLAVNLDGTSAGFYSAYDSHHAFATGDGWIFVPQALYLYCQDVGVTATSCTSAYTANVAAIKTALARDPRNGSTGLITVNLGNEYVAGMGFMEYMRNSGDVANANVWYAIVCQKMAALATAAGDSTNATFFNTQYANTVAAIKANLIDATSGMLIAATGQNSTNLDVVSSVLADYYGMLTGAQNTSIETYIAAHYSTLVNASGYILETPGGWATIGTIPAGGGAPYSSAIFAANAYQGGYWSFHFGWFANALSKATGGGPLVRSLLQSYVNAADPNTEWYNVGDATPKGTTPNLESPQGPYWAALNFPFPVAPGSSYLAGSGGGDGVAIPLGLSVASTVSIPHLINFNGGSTNNLIVNFTSDMISNTAFYLTNTTVNSNAGRQWADLVLGSAGGNGQGFRCWLDVTSAYSPFCLSTTNSTGTMHFANAAAIQWNLSTPYAGNPDVGLSNSATAVMSVDANVPGDGQGTVRTAALQGSGLTFGASGCSNSATSGGSSIGQFASGTSGTCTVTLTTTGMTAPHGWFCGAHDLTTPADVLTQTASSTTTATISGTTVSGDVIQFACLAY